MPASEQDILSALRSVMDPDSRKDLVALEQVKAIRIVEENVAIEIVTPSPLKDRIRQEITAAVLKIPGVEEVFVNFSAPLGAAKPVGHRPAPEQAKPKILEGVKHIVAVGAGKGGVGKSTIALNMAIALARLGKRVALLDGDIYGPSIPTLTGLGPRPPEVINDRIQPFTITSADGKASVAVMSIGFMVDREKALIWRGPMAHSAIKEFLEKVDWTGSAKAAVSPTPTSPAELDYLIVDLPPGTGDVALTLAQMVPLTGAVIVATPQEVALADARRAVRMFQQLSVEILGVVENMAYFVCEHGSEYDIFGKGGGRLMAEQMGLPFLGEVPIDVRLRRHSDAGTPFENFGDSCASQKPLSVIAENLDKQVAVRLATRPAAKPLNLKIS